MTPEQSKYFDDMENLFASTGWHNIVEDIKLRQDQDKNDLLAARRTSTDLFISYGREEVYKYLLTMEELLKEVKRRLQDNDDE